MANLKAVLFDLDGTLVDTAPDMAAALNRLLRKNNQSELPFSAIRNHVSKGALALVQLGFGETLAEDRLNELREHYLQEYADALCQETNAFTGMEPLLTALEEKSVPWGIVTNKPGWLTEPLLEQLGLLQKTDCVVSGDSLPHRKPHPEPILHACSKLNCLPNATVYIGDDERDIIAGNKAGTKTVVAAYGYILANETPNTWGANAIVNDVNQLSDWLFHNIK